jgi:hypothetical protein
VSAPKHAREIKGKGRYYGRCSDDCPFGDDLFISVTNAQGVVNKPALPPSAAKITAAAAWDRLPQMVATSRQLEAGNPVDGGKPCAGRSPVATRCGRCRFCVTAAIKGEYKQEWESKAELGTRIHTMAHAYVLGEPVPHDEEAEPFFQQYLEFLNAWDVDITQHVEAAETTIINRAKKYAGTGDVWLWLPIGSRRKRELVLVDIKTSLTKPATAVYPDQELQLAGLRFAPEALLPDDSLVPVPKFHSAALLNLRQNDHALIPLPAGKDAYKAFLGAVDLQLHFHDQDTKAWIPLDVPALPEPKKAVA